MADDEQGAVIRAQACLNRLERVDVEVVGWLV